MHVSIHEPLRSFIGKVTLQTVRNSRHLGKVVLHFRIVVTLVNTTIIVSLFFPTKILSKRHRNFRETNRTYECYYAVVV